MQKLFSSKGNAEEIVLKMLRFYRRKEAWRTGQDQLIKVEDDDFRARNADLSVIENTNETPVDDLQKFLTP